MKNNARQTGINCAIIQRNSLPLAGRSLGGPCTIKENVDMAYLISQLVQNG